MIGSAAFDAAKKSIFLVSIPSEARQYADIILRVAKEQGVDPMIIVALGQHESRWGQALDNDGKGDNGHGHGIMQIDDRSHLAWLDSHNWRDPYTNVTYGAQVFKQAYSYMGQKGLTGDKQLEAAIAAYNAGPGTVWGAIAKGLPPDAVTYTKHYANDVLRRISIYAQSFIAAGGLT